MFRLIRLSNPIVNPYQAGSFRAYRIQRRFFGLWWTLAEYSDWYPAHHHFKAICDAKPKPTTYVPSTVTVIQEFPDPLPETWWQKFVRSLRECP